MKMNINCGLASAAVGTALILGLSTHAQAVTPAAYSRACTEIVSSNGLIEKTVTRAGVYHRSARRTSRRVYRRRHY